MRRICEQAAEAIAYGANILVLSDRGVGPTRAAIPSLLAVAAVHHHLVREGTRLQAGLVLESGEPREVHHFATLIGYGASAINPYLMLESLAEDVAAAGRARAGRAQRRQGDRQGPAQDALEDGHLDDPVLQRRADLRGGRPRAPTWSSGTSPARRRASAASASTCSRARRSRATCALPEARGELLPGRRRLRVAPRRRAPPVEPARDRQAPARRPPRRPAGLRRVGGGGERGPGAARARCAGCSASTVPRGRRDPARRGRAGVARSSSASRPARCRSARSRARRTRRSRSR